MFKHCTQSSSSSPKESHYTSVKVSFIILYYHVLSGQTEPGMMSYCNDDLCVLYCVGFMWDLVMNMWWPEIAFFVLIGNWLVLRSLWEITQ